ncbi:hypothetical protein DFH06DRAFT_1359054 [Mycena polygramma]|nr:hypothetical protein DFH06DRAFT_1359054 [Mycena polygramma]
MMRGLWSEDEGFLNIENGVMFRTIVSKIQRRKAKTTLTWVEGHAGEQGNEAADKLADEGSAKNAPDIVNMKVHAELTLPGVKLQSLTQSLAYKMIRRLKMNDPKYQKKLARISTKRNLEYARAAAAGEDNDGLPPASKIWKSTKHEDLSRSIRFFLWMLVHDGYKVGNHWLQIPGHEEKGECTRCGQTKTMDHVLTKCEVAGQKEVWELASELWQMKTGQELAKPTTGQIMACAAIKKKDKGTTRFFRILVSESAHLIWKEPASINEIQNRWLKTINNRLGLDCALTNEQKWGKKALNKSIVLETWHGVLKNEGNLPKDWTWETGVLVGIG